MHVTKTGFQSQFARSTRNKITSYASNIEREAFQLESMILNLSILLKISLQNNICFLIGIYVKEASMTVEGMNMMFCYDHTSS